ncbi:MAG: pilus assembly protein [Deltaproteobacteria bacterium]|nr:MAG: pilus assembly protein [Deltaproteobacteria bacterium]
MPSQRGTGLTELILVLPILLFTIMASVDLGRLVYAYQGVNDLTREAGNLVSRGTDPNTAYAAMLNAEDALDLANEGGLIISRVRRRSTTSSTPWVVEQYRYGALGNAPSKVGSLGSAATIPKITSLAAGETITAVEVIHNFHPVFNLAGFGSAVFPNQIHEASFF